MQSFHHGLISRSSSASLSMAERSNVLDSTSDDLTIAQGLLNNSRNLGRQTSLTDVPASLQVHGGSILQDESSGSLTAAPAEGSRRGFHTSNTWTSSSGEILSEQDEVNDRSEFIHEYNYLANKHGVRTMTTEDYEPFNDGSFNASGKPGSWFSRKILRKTSSSQSIKLNPERQLKHKRSISDISLRLKSKKDRLKDKNLQELVRLCGSSLLYLPAEYAAGSLAVPTCFRATAQYLVQHAPTARGVFRIPGSHSTVALLYNHYCALDEDGGVISGTVRCPTLPEHIRCDVHDVASAFKKFISGLPGGILGSLPLFDAFISIQSQLHGDPELTRTKQSKIRARLIALAIATLKSQYRRELICAVLGLLCLIGRTAETSRREDDRGRPLPTSDLMGYGPLGIVFGPLLVGDLLENYTMRLANPHGGLVLLPISPPKSRKEKQKKTKGTEDGTSFNTYVDKIKVANGIMEMLITHWRDVVLHMKNLRALKTLPSRKSIDIIGQAAPFLRPSASDSFALRKPPDWDDVKSPIRRVERTMSPTPTSRTSGLSLGQRSDDSIPQRRDILRVRKQRSRHRPMSSQMLSGTRSMSILSPTTEEQSKDNSDDKDEPLAILRKGASTSTPNHQYKENDHLVTFSEPSKLPRKEDSSETPGSHTKLRKERPVQGNKHGHIPSPKTSGRHMKGSLSAKSDKSSAYQTTQDSYQIQGHSPQAKKPQIEANGRVGNMIHGQIRKLGQQDPSSPLSKSDQPNPEMKISRVSDVHEGTVSGRIRRIAASEPGQRPTPLVLSRRQVSKSVYVDSKGRVNAFSGASGPRDPLAIVSPEDDLASLAVLAWALADEHSVAKPTEYEALIPQNLTMGGAGNLSGTDPGQQKHEMPIPKTPRKLHISDLSSKSTSATSQRKRRSPTSILPQHVSAESKNSSNDTVITSLPTLNKIPNRYTITNSPGSNVKVLAAKFNTVDSGNSFQPPTRRSPTKPIIGDSRARFESPKDSLVAPYTTNPPSPTRSQKSTKSEKSPQSTRKSLGEPLPSFQAKNASPTKHSTSSWMLKDSANESAPSIPAQKSLYNAITPTDEPHPIKSPMPPSALEETIGRTLDGSPQAASAERLLPSLLPLENHGISAAMQVPGVSEDFGRVLGDHKVGTTLMQPAPTPGFHVHFASSNLKSIADAAGSTHPRTKENLLVSDTSTASITPPSRSNSILHTQIRNLQGQLSAKSEEIRKLRQQLDARSNLDIGTLSEQLREAKKDTQVWKTRAELSEKQVEMLTKIPSRSNSGQAVRNPLLKRHSEQPSSTYAGYSEDMSKVAERIRRALNGMDGAASSQEWNSELATDAVMRDVRETITRSEYSIWVQQMMVALDYTGPHEIE